MTMKTLLLTLLLATFCATGGHGQTVKSLGYNINGEVVYTGTNAMIFTNGFSLVDGETRAIDLATDAGSEFFYGINVAAEIGFFGTNAATAASATRTNLGLPLPALTNTSVTDFRNAISLEVTNGSSVEYAAKLWDAAASEQGFFVEDNEIVISGGTANTNAPADTTNAVRWINVNVGGNTYKIPLYQ
jgi:hypothetical protein